MDTIGKHLILDLWDVKENLTFSKNIVDDLIYILKELEQTVLDWSIHEFKNGAYTLIFLLGESHLSIHTWIESKYVGLDFYTCNPNTNLRIAKAKFVEFFKAGWDINLSLTRGLTHDKGGIDQSMKIIDIHN